MTKESTSFLLLRFLTASVLLGGGTALGATLIYEPFDYPVGDLSTESGGVWSDSGSTLEAGSLSYGSLATAGNKVTMSDDTSWTTTGTALNGFLDDGDTLWFSVVISPHSTSTNPDFGFALATDQGRDVNNVPLSTTDGGNGLGFRLKGGVRATAWIAGPATSSSATGVAALTPQLIVGEMIFGNTPTDLDTINIYLPDTDLNLGSIVQTQTAVLDQTAFDTITFMNKAASPRDEVDEIRFGDTYAAVSPVPEPASLTLLGLAGLGLLRRRR